MSRYRRILFPLAAAGLALALAGCACYGTYPIAGNHTARMRTFSGIDFMWIPPGVYVMGSPEGEACRQDHEGPARVVRITQGFWMSRTEVTQDQYEKVMGANRSSKQWGGLPVDNVSWYDAQEFCLRLSQAAGKRYFLPTEAQWEYACRAGSTSAFCFGDDPGMLQAFAYYEENAEDGFQNVGRRAHNAWGLYDMHGNVWEWCSDWYGPYDPAAPAMDPTGPETGEKRVVRGGGWEDPDMKCRSAVRHKADAQKAMEGVGFRVCRVK